MQNKTCFDFAERSAFNEIIFFAYFFLSRKKVSGVWSLLALPTKPHFMLFIYNHLSLDVQLIFCTNNFKQLNKIESLIIIRPLS